MSKSCAFTHFCANINIQKFNMEVWFWKIIITALP